MIAYNESRWVIAVKYLKIFIFLIIMIFSFFFMAKLDNSEVKETVLPKIILTDEDYKRDMIDELGNIPIMMYHGIVNKEGTYQGNYDKDGYTRTLNAFRNDLEMYYQKGYRMIKLDDYIHGRIDTEYGYSPIILTFDDGNDNNILVDGIDDNGDIIINKYSAVYVLEEFKKKYPDYNVTATFFVTDSLFNQAEYDEKIVKWLIEHGYSIGNHTKHHDNLSKIDNDKIGNTVGYMYSKLNSIIGDNYSKIVALPFGAPYNRDSDKFPYIIDSKYKEITYHTDAILRVGWEPEFSPFNKKVDMTYLKRCRAYDNDGKDFDIEYVFRMLDKNRYISDGNKDTIVSTKNKSDMINNSYNLEVILYE